MLAVLIFIIIGCLAVLLVKATPFLWEFTWLIIPIVWDASKILTILLLCTFVLIYFICWYMLYWMARFCIATFPDSTLFKIFRKISNNFRKMTNRQRKARTNSIDTYKKKEIIDDTRPEKKGVPSYNYSMMELDDLFISVGRYVTHYKFVSVRDLSKRFYINFERVNYILSQLLVYNVIERAPKTGTLVVKMSEEQFENLLSDPNLQEGIPKNKFRMLHEKPVMYSKY